MLFWFCLLTLAVSQPVRRTLTHPSDSLSVACLSVYQSTNKPLLSPVIGHPVTQCVSLSFIHKAFSLAFNSLFICCVQQEKNIHCCSTDSTTKSFKQKLFTDYFIDKLDSNALIISTHSSLLLSLSNDFCYWVSINFYFLIMQRFSL